MFDNIGSKIKSLAQVVCWIGIIASVIGGIIVMASHSDAAATGLLIIAIGVVGSWVGSFALYGFGQLIENSDTLVEIAKHNALKDRVTINAMKRSPYQIVMLTKKLQMIRKMGHVVLTVTEGL